MDELYREHILDHAHSPRNFGTLPKFSERITAENVSCGDSLEIFLEIDVHGNITALTWQGVGCAISMASASMLSEQVVGTSLQLWKDKSAADILEELGLEDISSARQKCALLFWKALAKTTQGEI